MTHNYQYKIVSSINMVKEAALGKDLTGRREGRESMEMGEIDTLNEESRLIHTENTSIPLDDDAGYIDVLKLSHISNLISIGICLFLPS